MPRSSPCFDREAREHHSSELQRRSWPWARRGSCGCWPALRAAPPVGGCGARSRCARQPALDLVGKRAHSPTALRAARTACLLAPSPIPLSVLATCLRTPAWRRRSNRSLSFLAIVFSSWLSRPIAAGQPLLKNTCTGPCETDVGSTQLQRPAPATPGPDIAAGRRIGMLSIPASQRWRGQAKAC